MGIPDLARLLIVACMFVTACVSRGAAQIPADCRAILATLEHNPRQVKLWSQVGRCGDAGARAVAHAFRQNRASLDVAYWTEFGEVAYGIRHPDLLHAALAVAADESSSFPARALGLQVALWQRSTNAGFARPDGHLLTLSGVLHGGVGHSIGNDGQRCVVPGIGGATPLISTALPSDVNDQIARTADTIAGDPDSPPPLKRMARCLRNDSLDEVPAPVDLSRLRVEYVCENVFRVVSELPEGVGLTFVVTGTDETGIITARPGETTFATETTGTVTVYREGRTVAATKNGGRACKP